MLKVRVIPTLLYKSVGLVKGVGFNSWRRVDTVLPVDIYVPGCAARPEAIIDGVVKAVALLDEKRKAMREDKKEAGQ